MSDYVCRRFTRPGGQAHHRVGPGWAECRRFADPYMIMVIAGGRIDVPEMRLAPQGWSPNVRTMSLTEIYGLPDEFVARVALHVKNRGTTEDPTGRTKKGPGFPGP